MQETTLVTLGGREAGSGPARRLRAAGRIPAVIYGHGTDPISVSVDRREFRNLVKIAGANALINLDIDGDTQLSIIKEMQQHPLKNRVDHIDFQLIRRDEAIVVDVHLEQVGEPEELYRMGGLVQTQMNSLTISAPASDIPQSIEVDISELGEGDAVRVGDLVLPSGVTTDVDPETVVASGIVTRAAAAAAEEGEEGVEGEEAAEATDADSGEGDEDDS